MRKKLRSLLVMALVLVMLSSTMAFAASQQNVSVYLNGTQIQFNDTKPVIENGTTLVPIAVILDALEVEYTWLPEYKRVWITTDDWVDNSGLLKFRTHYVGLDIGSTIVREYDEQYDAANPSLPRFANQIEKNVLSTPAKVIGGRTMVPLRFVSETLGYKVDWNQATKTITINDGSHVQTNLVNNQNVTEGGDNPYLDMNEHNSIYEKEVEYYDPDGNYVPEGIYGLAGLL